MFTSTDFWRGPTGQELFWASSDRQDNVKEPAEVIGGLFRSR
jgi:hypothetical protein